MGYILGVDLSHWNGSVDVQHLADLGVKFAMLKLGGEESSQRGYKIDTRFYEYYHLCKKYGIKVGAYMFAGSRCYLWNAEENANHFIDYMERNNIKLDYPFAIDIETQPTATKEKNTEYVRLWCKTVEKRGYFAMIYGSDVSTFKGIINGDDLKQFAFWVARYGGESRIQNDWAIWQFTNNIRESINKRFPKNMDGNYARYDIAAVIEKKHLNRK